MHMIPIYTYRTIGLIGLIGLTNGKDTMCNPLVGSNTLIIYIVLSLVGYSIRTYFTILCGLPHKYQLELI